MISIQDVLATAPIAGLLLLAFFVTLIFRGLFNSVDDNFPSKELKIILGDFSPPSWTSTILELGLRCILIGAFMWIQAIILLMVIRQFIGLLKL